jgi:hypothetical protein
MNQTKINLLMSQDYNFASSAHQQQVKRDTHYLNILKETNQC